MFELFLAIGAIGIIVGPWILAGVALSRSKRTNIELDKLRALISELDANSAKPSTTSSEQALTPIPEDEQAPSTSDQDEDTAEPPAPVEGEEPIEAIPVEGKEPATSDQEQPGDPAPETPLSGISVPSAPDAGANASLPDAASAKSDTRVVRSKITTGDLERSLASRWLVWLGGITLALAGVFLITYAIEQGLLGPKARVALGFLFGFALIIGAEWVRRRPFQRAVAKIQSDYVPSALSAAGVFTLYASALVGHALYGLYGPVSAFVVMAAIAICAIAIALLQGWFVAALGILGSFLTPAVIPDLGLSPGVLFPYLAIVLGTCVALVRYKAWWPLAYASLGLSAGWVFYSLIDYSAGDAPVLGLFILVFTGLFQLARLGHLATDRPVQSSADFKALHPSEVLGWAGLIAGAILVFALVRTEHYGTASLLTLGVFSLGAIGLARRQVAFDLAIAVAAGLTLALFASWHVPKLVDSLQFVDPLVAYSTELTGPILAPELTAYTTAALLFGILFGAGGFIALWGARRVMPFAAVSAFTPVLLFGIAYWRFLKFGQDLNWAVIALVLAAVALLAAGAIEKYRHERPLQIAIGFYAAAVTSFVSLGLAMTLKEAWLTVALSAQLPALAWIHSRLKADPFRLIAKIVAAVVLIRLLPDDNVFSYRLESGSVFNWVLYGYGIPAVAFFIAARSFAKDAKDTLITILEAGALLFAVLFVSFEIRFLVSGSLSAPYDSFLEQSLQSIAWLALGYGVLVNSDKLQLGHQPVLLLGSRILLGMAAVQVLGFQILLNSPLQSVWQARSEVASIGSLPFFNLMLLAYLVPAIFALALVRVFGKKGEIRLANIAGAIGMFVLLFYISLEVKHWFQGEHLDWRFLSDAENYAISIAWLTFALALLSAGIKLGARALRYASLAVLLLTVLKVFLGDMAGLVGLYRVGSFLGLGLCLVGIGYIYQRFVFTEAAGLDEPENDGPE